MARTKKEFSKEAMYNKIMPSMLKNPEINKEKKLPVDIIINDKAFNEDIHIDTSIQDINEEVKTVNFIELLILEKLDAVLSKFKCCTCESCKNDIISIVLNKFPTYNFSGTDKEIVEAFNKFKMDNDIDIISEIIKAIILIRKKEKH